MEDFSNLELKCVFLYNQKSEEDYLQKLGIIMGFNPEKLTRPQKKILLFSRAYEGRVLK